MLVKCECVLTQVSFNRKSTEPCGITKSSLFKTSVAPLLSCRMPPQGSCDKPNKKKAKESKKKKKEAKAQKAQQAAAKKQPAAKKQAAAKK